MRRRTLSFILGVPAVLALQAGPLAAQSSEIKHRIEDGEIVISNLHVKRTFTKRDLAAPPRSRVLRGSAAAPDSPPGIVEEIDRVAQRYSFDPALLRSIIAAESAFDRMAVSKKGARGLMQLMPETAREYGVRDVHDAADNLNGGASYLRSLLSRFDHDMELALAAYNAGPEAVIRHGGVPPYRETREYLRRIRRYYGANLDKGNWMGRSNGIRISEIEKGGVPRFTNLPSRKVIRHKAKNSVHEPRKPDDE